MDRFTQHYLQDMVKPMTNRLEYLQMNNEELKIHIKYLESLILNNIKSYQKLTVSANKHMRQSRVNSKDGESLEKRPNWNSKTKVDEPAYNRLNLSLDLEDQQDQRIRNQQQISTNRRYSPDQQRKSPNRKERRSQRIVSITKDNQSINNQQRYSIDGKGFNNKQEDQQEQGEFQQNNGLIQQRFGEIGSLTFKFQQLVRCNANILSSMKKQNQNAREALNIKESPTDNYVDKVRSPQSAYFYGSQNDTPNDRSFISQPIKDKEFVSEDNKELTKSNGQIS